MMMFQPLKTTISIPNKIVRVFDWEARPIKRGKVKAKIKVLGELEEGLIAYSHIEEDNPADKALAAPMVKKSMRVLNKAPKEERFLLQQ